MDIVLLTNKLLIWKFHKSHSWNLFPLQVGNLPDGPTHTDILFFLNCDQASEIRQQFVFALELEFDIRGKMIKLLIPCNTDHIQSVLTIQMTLV